jgi:hypothetical protein
MNIHEQQRPCRPAELIWRQVDDGIVIVSPTAGQVRVLNPMGSHIWEQLDGQHSLGDIEQSLIGRYPHIPATQIHTDLHQFLNELSSRGLVSF